MDSDIVNIVDYMKRVPVDAGDLRVSYNRRCRCRCRRSLICNGLRVTLNWLRSSCGIYIELSGHC